MKRAIALLMLMVFILGSAACARPKDQETDALTVPTGEAYEAPVTAVPAEQTDEATSAPDVTAEPTAEQTAAPTSAPTTAPTAAATPTQTTGDGSITFSESASLPLPGYYGEDIPYGQPFCFGGVVKSSAPILSVSAVITSSSGVNKTYTVSFAASDNKTSVELVDRTFPSSGNNSLTAKVKFQELAAGTYTFSLYASTTASTGVLLKSRQFKIVSSEWKQLISNNLRNNYAYALSFFGSRDQFMFRYKWADGRNITVESSWMSSHFTSVTSPSGGTWYVHKLAAPKFNQAINYMKNTYVRVSGGGYDSGVIKLSTLIASFDGILNTRFVSDRTFVSHHAFGTAIDLNASMDANVNVISNRNLIKTEVRDHLVYNGIKEYNGVKYYDFTYNGSHASHYKGVPTTVVNYLLYELAFYRAGFSWGYYYDHACDGMHFAVSEMSPDIHNTSGRSLRKVYSYIG